MSTTSTSIKFALLLTALLVAPILLESSARAETIYNINMRGRSGPGDMTTAETAGVVHRANWNNIGDPNGVPPGSSIQSGSLNNLLEANTGAASTVSVAWGSGDNWRNNQGNASNGDQHMMWGFFSQQVGQTPASLSVTVTNLPASFGSAPYNVYVYTGSDTGVNYADYTLTAPSTSPTITTTVRSSWDSETVFTAGVYQKANGMNAANGGNNLRGNFILYTNVTGTSFKVDAPAITARSGIMGVQIVQPDIVNQPVALSGFTSDVVFEDAAGTITAAQFGGAGDATTWFESRQGANSDGMPRGGTFISENDITTKYQLAPYTANNCLLLGANASATLTCSAQLMTNIRILATSSGAQPTTTGTFYIKYSDGSDTSLSPSNFNAFDWGASGANNGRPANAAWSRMGRSSTSGTAFNYSHPADFNLWETQIANPNPSKQVVGFTFTAPAGVGNTGIFAVSAQSPAQGPITLGSVTPSTGSTLGNTAANPVVVSATSGTFVQGATVSLGGTVLAGTIVDSTHLSFIPPAHAAGPVNVFVVNGDSQQSANTLTNAYTYQVQPPAITSLSPNTGPTAGGTVVTITGTGFGPGAAVTFGGVSATAITVNGPTSITATTPAGTTGQRDVVVTNTDTQSSTKTGGFTYINNPSISPQTQIVGTGFGTGTAPIQFFSTATQTVTLATTPSGAAGTSLYYTLDGSTPTFPVTGTTTLYSAPFTVSTNTIVKVIEVVNSNGTVSGVVSGQFTPFLAASATPVAIAQGVLNVSYYDGGPGVVPNNWVPTPFPNTAAGHSGPVVAIAPDVLSNYPGGTAGPFATGTTPPPTGQKNWGFILNGRPSAYGDSNVAFNARITGIFVAPSTGVYTLATGTDDGSILYIDGFQVVANNAGQGVTRRLGQVGLVAGQHTIQVDFGNGAGGYGIELAWDPTGANNNNVANLVNIPNANLTVQATLAALIAPATTTYGGTSVQINLNSKVAIGTGSTTGSFIFYTTDGSTPTFDGSFNATGTTTKYTTPFALSSSPGVVNAIAAGPGYIQSAVATQTYTRVLPTVTSITPNIGPPSGGQNVTIIGANFSPTATVSIGGDANTGDLCTNVVVVNPTTITAKTGQAFNALQGNPSDVIVTNNNGDKSVAGNQLYTYTGPPTITSISPTTGPSLGGTPFTLSGTNFASGFSIKFGTDASGNGGVAATNLAFTNTGSVTGNTPVSPIPPPFGQVNVTYTGADGRKVTSTNLFTYTASPSPTVTNVSPSIGGRTGGTTIAITGTGFLPSDTVTVNGIAATGVVINSNTSITAVTPASASSGSKDVIVTRADGLTGTLLGGFTYLAGSATGTAISINFNGSTQNGGVTTDVAPTDLIGTPSVARTHWNNIDTNTSPVTTGFVDSTGAAVANISLSWASNENWNSTGTQNDANPNSRMMRCYIDNTNNAAIPIIVSNIPASYSPYDIYFYNNSDNQGSAGGRSGIFKLTSTTPNVSNILTVLGSVFGNGTTTFVEASPDGATHGNYTVFRGVSNATAAGATNGFEVDVTATGGDFRCGITGIQIVSYGFQAAGVVPGGGPVNTATPIKIKGVGFSNATPANLAVTIGGQPATAVTFIDANTISATTPSNISAVGPADVVVTNGDAAASQSTITGGFVFTGSPPTIDSFTPINPTAGITSGGTNVTITGTNFLAGATVTIKGIAATNVVVVSSTSITATTGASTSPGVGNVTVTNPGPQTATANNAFTYLAPTVTSISPPSGAASGNYSFTVTGTNFGSQSKVQIGGILATGQVVVNSTTITGVVPASNAGAIGAVDVVVTDGGTAFGTLSNGFTYVQTPADTVGATVAGIEAKFYLNGGTTVPNANAPSGLPTALDSLIPVKGLRVDPAITPSIMTGPITNANPAANGTLDSLIIDTLGAAAINYYAKFYGYINITTPGAYTFSMASDDGAILFISNSIVIDNNPEIAAQIPKNGVINLAAGMHAFTVLHGQGGGGFSFALQYSGPDNGNVLGFVPDNVLFINAGSPTISALSTTTGSTGGNTGVTITGTGFVSGATVAVNGTSAVNVKFVNSTTITFFTPGGPNGPVNVVVVNPNGLAATIRPFTYDNTIPRSPDNPTDVVQGTYFRYYKFATSPPGGVMVPDIIYKADNLLPFRNGWRADTFITGNNNTLYPIDQNDNHAVLWIGYITVPSTGTYTFTCDTDDGFVLSIGNVEINRYDNGQGQNNKRTGTANLAAGTHAFRYAYSQGGGGFGSLNVQIAGPGITGTVDIGTNGTSYSYRPPTWSGGTANFNSQASWFDNIVPDKTDTAANANETVHLRFPDVGASAYTATNDRPAPFHLFKIELQSNINANNTIAGNQFQFVGSAVTNSPAGAAPNIDQTGSKSFTISAPIDVRDNMKLLGSGAGVVTLSGVISNANSITKAGTSTYKITNVANTFTGALNVTAGTLQVDGTMATASGVAVTGGAALRGSGTVPAITTVTGTGSPVVWPGAATQVSALSQNETLTGTSVNLTNAGKLKVVTRKASGPFNQKLSLSGPIVIDSTSVLSLAYDTGNYVNQYVVLTTSDTNAADLPTTAFNSVLPANDGFSIGYSQEYDVIYKLGGVNGTQVGAASPTLGATIGSWDTVVIKFKGSVTPVTVDSFTAKPEGAGVLLEWNSVSEYQNAGFQLERRAFGEMAEWQRINPTLINGRITNADSKRYSFYDWAPAGRFEYRLQSLSIQGETENYKHLAGPVAVEASGFAINAMSASSIDAALGSVVTQENLARAQAASAAFSVPTVVEANAAVSEVAVTSVLARDAQGHLLHPAQVRDLSVESPTVALAARASTPAGVVPTANPVAAARWFTPGRPTAGSSLVTKVVYDKAGVLAIKQASLPTGFDIQHVSIQRAGASLPALAVSTDTLYVYVPGYSDDYTDKDALFLRKIIGNTQVSNPAQASGLFTSAQPVNASSAASVSTSYHDVYFDYNTAYRPYTFPPWFSSQYLTDGSDCSFDVATPNASGGSASMTVNVWSLTSSDVTPDHALQVLVNGQPAGQAQWTGGGKMMQLTFSLPSGILNAASNKVELVTPVLAGVSGQVSFVHSIRIDYTKTLNGSQSQTLANTTRVPQLYELSGLTTPTAWIVDARFPDRPAMTSYEAQAQADGTYKIRFMAAAGGTGQFQITPAGQENSALSVTKRTVSPLRSGTTYLAVGPSQFSMGVQPLLTLRSKEGLKGLFVDQEAIFDYYGYGRYGPAPIQSAVRAIHPQYLLLVGRTTYDYHNYSGMNVDPLCPAFLVSTTFWAQTTSDSLYGDLGRGMPEVAVGRLPVNDTTDLAGAVNHIMHYRGPTDSGVRLQLTADTADPKNGDFPAQADSIAQTQPELSIQRNYMGVNSASPMEAGAKMQDAANGGADWLLYVGHGNALGLGAASPSILDTTSVQKWTGNTVLMQSTCTANWMAKDVQNYHSVAIQALTQPQGGISASIATSTYMNSDHAVGFMAQLLKNAGPHGTRWGTALMKSQQWALQQKNDGMYQDLGNTEQLFGDPAMPIYSSGGAGAQATTTPAGPAAGTF